jgi:monoterpene epsilon-lactone hydrolase
MPDALWRGGAPVVNPPSEEVAKDQAASHSSQKEQSGTVRVGAYTLPISEFFDAQARAAFEQWMRWNAEIAPGCPGHWTDPEVIPSYRRFLDTQWYPEPIKRSLSLYPVDIEPRVISGVPTEVFSPMTGVSEQHRDRLLINLHGGGFCVGARYGGQIESIPVSAIGRITVVSVDYRMAPEYEFPAATEDVIAVYQELLKAYDPQCIGIFGCSAGALLTAQVVARLHRAGVRLPGAIGMFCCSGSYWGRGDSAHLGTVLAGEPLKAVDEIPYFKHVKADDPMAFPAGDSKVLSQFPPSMLVSATRDFVLSSVVDMHSRLAMLGVRADLHVWEGLGHSFFYDPDLPQSREVHVLTTKFFERHLGQR